MVRCPSCGGLRGICKRHENRYSGRCKECVKGIVVKREVFHTFWTKRFSLDEISQMAAAIWGD